MLSDNRKKITISLDKEMSEWLNIQAQKEDRTKGKVIERLLRDYKEKIENN